jgi:flagellar biosynthesis protein FlhG
LDQAELLREMVRKETGLLKGENRNAIEIYALVSGRKGIVKTDFLMDLAAALKKKGRKPLLMLPRPSVAKPSCREELPPWLFNGSLRSVSDTDVIDIDYEGIKILLFDYCLSEAFADKFLKLNDVDIILADAGGGINLNTLSLISFSQKVILITPPGPSDLADAYRLVKVMEQCNLSKDVRVVIDRCPDFPSGMDAYDRLHSTSAAFLNKPLKNLGCIINGALADKQADEKEINEIAEAVMKEQSSSRIYSMEQVYERLKKVYL